MFDRTWTFGLANNAGPQVNSQSLALPGGEFTGYLEAWISNFGSSNVHILRGRMTLAQALATLEGGFTDVLMTVTGAGRTRVRLPDDVDEITVLFEATNTSGQFQAVTIRITGSSSLKVASE